MTIAQNSNHETRARLSVIPLTASLPKTPHLVPHGSAMIGDFIGVFGGIYYDPDRTPAPETHIEVAYKKGVLEPENFFVDEMSDVDAATFREIVAIPFGGLDHDLIVRQGKMVEEDEPYQIHLVQFAEAILYVHPDWLQGTWGHNRSRPLMMMMEGAKSPEEAARCLEKTKRHMKLFRAALPANIRAGLNLKLPHLNDFHVNGGPTHAYVR